MIDDRLLYTYAIFVKYKYISCVNTHTRTKYLEISICIYSQTCFKLGFHYSATESSKYFVYHI